MALTISESVFIKAKEYMKAGDISAAWKILANAGDIYADSAYKIINEYLIIIIPKLYLVAYLVVEVFSVLQMLA